MFAADSGTNTALVVGLVLCAVAFAALVLVLYRVLVALADLRSDLACEIKPADPARIAEMINASNPFTGS